MNYNRIILFILIGLLLSCGGNDDSSNDPVLPEEQENDDISPEINASGIGEIIEVMTDITIAIIDQSAVETEILLDGEEIFSSTLKEFTYNFNPYIIPVGPHTIVVRSTDNSGNENSRTFEVDIKHLLMSYEYGAQENDRNPFKWIFHGSDKFAENRYN